MMNNPLISVIVPVYKVEKYLKQCVDSILNQSFTGFELILHRITVRLFVMNTQSKTKE